MYTPDTAVAGTLHAALSLQLPQSTRPVELLVRQFGWLRPATLVSDAIFRAPIAGVVTKAVDVDVECRRDRVHLEANRLAFVDADVGGEALNGAVSAAGDVPF